MDDLEKQFREFYNKTRVTLDKLPVLAAQEAVNFFQDSFKKQTWSGQTQEVWKKRKTDKNTKDSGRALLVKTGRLKRSIRKIKADWDGIIVGTDLTYAEIHNNGFNGTQQVNAHYRTASRKVSTKFLKSGKASIAKNAFTRVKSKGHDVKAHSRKINMPRRRFIGDSPFLDTRINRIFINELNKI
jgi:phage gpG-like protein